MHDVMDSRPSYARLLKVSGWSQRLCYLTALMLTISCFLETGRYKTCWKQLTATAPQLAYVFTLRKPRGFQHSSLMSSAKQSCLGSMFIANGQRTEEIRSRINPGRSAFSRLQSCLWLRCEISLRTKCRVTQTVVCSILIYGCQTLAVLDNDSICQILLMRRRDCIQTVEL